MHFDTIANWSYVSPVLCRPSEEGISKGAVSYDQRLLRRRASAALELVENLSKKLTRFPSSHRMGGHIDDGEIDGPRETCESVLPRRLIEVRGHHESKARAALCRGQKIEMRANGLKAT